MNQLFIAQIKLHLNKEQEIEKKVIQNESF